MNARIVAPSRGLRWIAEGARMFAAAPAGWMLLAFSFLMFVLLLSRLPLLGPPLSMLLYPGLTVGFMVASRASALRQRLEVQMLAEGFRERAKAQVVLGALYLVGTVLAIVGASFADDGAMLGQLLGRVPAEGDGAAPGGTARGMLATLALMTPTAMLLFYAPLLVAWHAMPPIQAAFYSFFACVMNWRAFALYLAAGIALLLLGSNLVVAVGLSVAGASARAQPAALLSFLALGVLLVALPIMMASFYASYRDVFGAAGER